MLSEHARQRQQVERHVERYIRFRQPRRERLTLRPRLLVVLSELYVRPVGSILQEDRLVVFGMNTQHLVFSRSGLRDLLQLLKRSEERRVGKAARYWWTQQQ